MPSKTTGIVSENKMQRGIKKNNLKSFLVYTAIKLWLEQAQERFTLCGGLIAE